MNTDTYKLKPQQAKLVLLRKSRGEYICLNAIWNNQIIKLDVEEKEENTQINLWNWLLL